MKINTRRSTTGHQGIRQRSHDTRKLKNIEKMFLVLLGIFLIVSFCTNVLHEFDVSSSAAAAAASKGSHPQFSGVTFRKKPGQAGLIPVHEIVEDVIDDAGKEGSMIQHHHEGGTRSNPNIQHSIEKINDANQQSHKIPKNDHKEETQHKKQNKEIEDDDDKEIEDDDDSTKSEKGKSEKDIIGKDDIELDKNTHELGGLSCAAYGGPSDEVASEMVYWSDIPEDAKVESPFKRKRDDGRVLQYMTFEPDEGGWNNIRMAMETVVVLAHAMGRTLVLPPAQGIYLLRKDRGKQNTDFSFADFFHLESLSNEHSGIDIISHEEFLIREAMTGNMKNKTTGEVSFPPMNQTNWDGKDVKPLKEWLRDVTLTPIWAPDSCLAAFPASSDPKGADDLHSMLEIIQKEGFEGGNSDRYRYRDHPTPVDGETIDRMREALANRKKLCIYDQEMQAAPVIHFITNYKMGARLLTHFYSFVFFENWQQQLWTNRFVRDHLRYLDELQCAAARVVDKLHSIARSNGESSGEFDTFHVRRGDFQYKMTRVEADVLYEESKAHLPPNATLYIATDERKKDFFYVLQKNYNVYFLDDFQHLFAGLNTNYYGMLDQLIASKGRTFHGTYYSTFTGYINRMRGYTSTKFELEGGKNGTINSYYFVPVERQNEMRHYESLRGPFFAREFPTSWYDIDKDA